MATRKHLGGASLFRALILLPSTLAHMQMSWPYPLRSEYNPENTYMNIDYSMTSPLNADGSNFPCKGYQNDRPIQTVIAYTAGSTYNMSLAGTATHGGGSCQLSLSYDNGATFRVIKSMIGGCPLTSTYDFTIPSYAPAGTALLAWTWQNLEGNREFYMNCAEVNIMPPSMKRRHRRKSFTSLDQLPYIWKANLAGINDCQTEEQVNVVYPEPGPDVTYGDGLSDSSSPTAGECDDPTPYGQTYENPDNSTMPSTSANQTSSSGAGLTVAPTASPSTSTISTTSSTTYSGPNTSTLDLNAEFREVADASPSNSTTTVTMNCPATVYVTVSPSPSVTTTTTYRPSYYTTAATGAQCTGTSVSCPCAPNYQCQEMSPCTWACQAQATSTPEYTSTVVDTRTGTVTPVRPTSSHSHTYTYSSYMHTYTHASYTGSGSHSYYTHSYTSHTPYATADQPYATPNVEAYLPCVPGTFICISDTTWDTCDYNDGSDPDASSTSYVYDYPRSVAAGMQCVTFLSPYSSNTNQYGQQAMTPNGYYRDDRIVRATPDGYCNQEGALRCTDGGQMFDICDQGVWVRMGSVAQGTQCQNGQIVASGG